MYLTKIYYFHVNARMGIRNVPNRVTGFHQYGSFSLRFHNRRNRLIDSPVRIAQSTPDPRVADSISRCALFFPPAQCFVWYLEIFHVNGDFICFFYLTLLELLVKTVDPSLPELPFAIRADDFMLGLD